MAGTSVETAPDPITANLYDTEESTDLPEKALAASLGCGNPTGVAYGVDMTDEMLELARENAREAGVDNVEFLKGQIEDLPLPDASVDVILSNCVINLSTDKARVLREAAGFVDVDVEPTRIYRADDAEGFLSEAGLDPDSAAEAVDGKIMAAFVRARKPERTAAGADARAPVGSAR